MKQAKKEPRLKKPEAKPEEQATLKRPDISQEMVTATQMGRWVCWCGNHYCRNLLDRPPVFCTCSACVESSEAVSEGTKFDPTGWWAHPNISAELGIKE